LFYISNIAGIAWTYGTDVVTNVDILGITHLSTYSPTNGLNKIQFITINKTPACFGAGCHPQGVIKQRNISPTP
jgi:hypothetical protein